MDVSHGCQSGKAAQLTQLLEFFELYEQFLPKAALR